MLQNNDQLLQLSISHWVRIWFSTNPSQGLPELHKQRTKQFLQDNPEQKMTIISSYALLDTIGKKDLFDFETEVNNDNLSFNDFCSDEENLLSIN